jgi:hypothetical protein
MRQLDESRQAIALGKKMSASKLYSKYTMQQLTDLRSKLCDNPDNKSGTGLYLYKPKVRKKLDDIDRAITFHLADLRKERGQPINEAGYSGRNSKR